jgi:hypothetical protein
MKFIISLLLTALLGYTAYLFHDAIAWWGFSLGAFLVGWIVPQKAWLSWLAGFTGMLLCWGIISWNINNDNQGLLAGKMSQLFGLAPNAMVMIVITALLGAIVGGFAALIGAFLRKKPLHV